MRRASAPFTRSRANVRRSPQERSLCRRDLNVEGLMSSRSAHAGPGTGLSQPERQPNCLALFLGINVRTGAWIGRGGRPECARTCVTIREAIRSATAAVRPARANFADRQNVRADGQLSLCRSRGCSPMDRSWRFFHSLAKANEIAWEAHPVPQLIGSIRDRICLGLPANQKLLTAIRGGTFSALSTWRWNGTVIGSRFLFQITAIRSRRYPRSPVADGVFRHVGARPSGLD
jgi:hypothetical protein